VLLTLSSGDEFDRVRLISSKRMLNQWIELRDAQPNVSYLSFDVLECDDDGE
jgi:hypothetical protein